MSRVKTWVLVVLAIVSSLAAAVFFEPSRVCSAAAVFSLFACYGLKCICDDYEEMLQRLLRAVESTGKGK